MKNRPEAARAGDATVCMMLTLTRPVTPGFSNVDMAKIAIVLMVDRNGSGPGREVIALAREIADRDHKKMANVIEQAS
jgi:hypothetical protein